MIPLIINEMEAVILTIDDKNKMEQMKIDFNRRKFSSLKKSDPVSVSFAIYHPIMHRFYIDPQSIFCSSKSYMVSCLDF